MKHPKTSFGIILLLMLTILAGAIGHSLQSQPSEHTELPLPLWNGPESEIAPTPQPEPENPVDKAREALNACLDSTNKAYLDGLAELRTFNLSPEANATALQTVTQLHNTAVTECQVRNPLPH